MRVVVIDDDAIVCRALETLLGEQPDVEVVATGTDGNAAVRLFSQHVPDVLLMDIQMPQRDGLTAAEEIIATHPDARIVFLTTFADDDYIVRALRLGARGYLIKQDVSAIAPALRLVVAGQCVLEGEVLERAAVLGMGQQKQIGSREERALACLTEREREVVRCVADGLDNSDTAAELCMSEGTVRNHISSILTKLDLRNRTQIAVYYYRNCV